MMFRPDLALLTALALAAALRLSAEPEEKGQVTERCVPQSEIVPAEPTYVPNVPFTLELRPVSGDWPTTPTAFGWVIGDDSPFLGDQVQEFTLGQDGADFVQVLAGAEGPGFPGECTIWSTGTKQVIVRRFDATPTPVPTVTPTPSPTFPCTPAGLACSSSEVQDALYPRHLTEDNPISFIMKIPGTFRGLETAAGSRVPVVDLGNGEYQVTNLRYDTVYIAYYTTGSCSPPDYVPGPNSCLLIFGTMDEPPPTPTPSITTPMPTPSVTVSPTTATLTMTPTPTVTASPTTATLTVTMTPSPTVPTPTPTAPTPTPTPVRPLQEGWILSEGVRGGERAAGGEVGALVLDRLPGPQG